MKKTILLVLSVAAIFTVVACGKAKNSGSVRGRTARGGTAVTPGGTTNTNMGQPGVVSSHQSEDAFSQQVASFVSSVLAPQDVGRVNPNGGVQIQGAIYYSCSTGAVYTQYSKIKITITDEFVQQNAE